MNSLLLSTIINDQINLIKRYKIIDREFSFEPNANYVFVGLRRSGKSTLLYKKVQDLLKKGIDEQQLIYVNFEDVRLENFTANDFNDLLTLRPNIDIKDLYIFLDEVQIIPGWEKFARRMADYHVKTYITGSNAKMLSSQISTTLGARYLTKFIQPFNFRELLKFKEIEYQDPLSFSTSILTKIKDTLTEYLHFGGFPEASFFIDKRYYVASVYQKILLGDIVSRYKLRNANVLSILIGTIAESVKDELSYSKLSSILKTIGTPLSRQTLVDYIGYAKDSYLIFPIYNYIGKHAEREGYPKYYFGDNGLLNLHLANKDALLLENLVAINLYRKYENRVYYLKSKQREYDIDFFIPEEQHAIQVAYSVNDTSAYREISNLVKLAKYNKDIQYFSIITYDQEQTLEVENITINIIPIWKWLLSL